MLSDAHEGEEGAVDIDEIKNLFEKLLIACIKSAAVHMVLRDNIGKDEPLVNLISLTAEKQEEIMGKLDTANTRVHEALVSVGDTMGTEAKCFILEGLAVYAGDDVYERFVEKCNEEQQ